MTVEELRDILLKIMDGYERLVTENLALKAVMENAVPKSKEPPLQKQVAGLIEDAKQRKVPEFNEVLQRYHDLRQQIRQALEDRQLIELLQQFPPEGGIN